MRRPLLFLTVVLAFGGMILRILQAEQPDDGAVQPAFYAYGLTEEESYRPLTLQGKVLQIEKREEGWVYILKTEKKQRIRVISKNPDRPKLLETVMVSGNAWLFDAATNPGEFDYRAYYQGLNILAGMSEEDRICVKPPPVSFPEKILCLRLRLLTSISCFAEDGDRGVFETLLCGAKEHLDPEKKEQYTDFGLLFLISYSGIHLSLAAQFLYRLVRKRLGKGPAFTASAVLLIFLYFFTNASAAVLRASLVFLVKAAAPLFKRRFDYLSAVSLSFILLILNFPQILYISTFQYLVSAAAGVGLFMPAVSAVMDYKHPFERGFVFMFSLQAAVLPVKLYWNFSVSLYSLLSQLSSVLLLPFLLVSVLLGALAGLVSGPLSVFFFGTGHYLLRLIDTITATLDSLPHPVLTNGRPSVRLILLYYALFLALILIFRLMFCFRKHVPEKEEKDMKPFLRRLMIASSCLLWVLGLFILKAPKPAENELWITVLDVGQGDCTVFMYEDMVMVSDCGSSSKEEVGERILLPYLQSCGISRVDFLLLSHGDNDHTNGVLKLFEELPVQKLILPGHHTVQEEFASLLPAAEENGAELFFLSSGDEVRYGNLSMDILWPEKDADLSGNDGSLVVLLSVDDFKGLLTGDISSETEDILDLQGPVTWLKTAHHGSKYSSDAAFLSRVCPHIATISAGRNNPYGHPAPETLERLKDINAEIYTTPRCGAVMLFIRDRSCIIKTFLDNE